MVVSQKTAVRALVLLVTASALLVTIVKDLNRAAFIELDGLQGENTALRAEWGRLQLEYSAFGMDGRIEMLARAQAGMEYPREIIAVEVK